MRLHPPYDFDMNIRCHFFFKKIMSVGTGIKLAEDKRDSEIEVVYKVSSISLKHHINDPNCDDRLIKKIIYK